MARPRGCLFLTLLAALALSSACRTSLATQVVPIAVALPAEEETHYRIESDSGESVGQVTLSIGRDGADLRLGIAILARNGSVNEGVSLVDRVTLQPREIDRAVKINGRTFSLHESFDNGSLKTSLDDGKRTHTQHLQLPESAYDDQESLFLWRTLSFVTGYSVRYVDVLVNPETGAVSRPAATVRVTGKEPLSGPEGNRDAWRVEFSAGGFTNIAWFEDSPVRRLLKYRIPAQQISYLLDEPEFVRPGLKPAAGR